MSDLGWRESIVRVLEANACAMHYAEIAEEVAAQGLRSSLGATPASTVNAYISTSLNQEGRESPFVRVSRGQYILRKHADDIPEIESSAAISKNLKSDASSEDPRLVHAFGMFWQRELVYWTSSPSMLGRQQIGATAVDFASQIGVYLLYDARDVVYVGRAIDRPMGRRLYEHTQDRLRGRWDRFSWFGLLEVTEDGTLIEGAIEVSPNMIIATLEAMLIEGLEPPQNRRRGDGFGAVEYLQSEDPEIQKAQMSKLLSEMQQKLGT